MDIANMSCCLQLDTIVQPETSLWHNLEKEIRIVEQYKEQNQKPYNSEREKKIIRVLQIKNQTN